MCTFLTPLVTALEKNYYDAKNVTVLKLVCKYSQFISNSMANIDRPIYYFLNFHFKSTIQSHQFLAVHICPI